MRIAGVVVALIVCLASGCAPIDPDAAPGTGDVPTSAAIGSEPTTSAPVEPVAESVRLVRWLGPVDALFVHPLILRPRLAFTRDAQGQGFLDFFVTAREFRTLLDELWRNGWTRVDVHKAAAGADVVPIVEAAVAAHPELSAEGAKGVLAVTGFEGLLGELDPEQPAARRRLARLTEQLRSDGWTFASHTYGHIDLSTATPEEIREDSDRWRAQADVLGPVDILVYPYGARPGPAALSTLVQLGYPIQVDIDVEPRRRRIGGAVVMSRRHVDGLAFDAPMRQRPFYRVARVRDSRRPPG